MNFSLSTSFNPLVILGGNDLKRTLSLIIAAAALGLSGAAIAQDAGPKGGAPKQGNQGGNRGPRMNWKRMQEIQKEILAQLNLTADQKKKVEALNKKTADALMALREKQGDRQAMRAEMRKINDAHRDEFKSILTKEQHQKYRQLMQQKLKELREKEGKTGKGGNGKSGGG